ncbi:GIY-YIG nuclease family protein [Pseudobacillus sp. 179-B 2D1 NHS]|uniref:GIY-YIG nuclease family protein n=1 Tax=Pseudobacillus sp. 179-B 2D1 NHS TaxID=3374292 RepID=UPI003879559A
MKKDVEDLLKKKGYYPLTSPLWNSFRLAQVVPNSNQEKQTNIKLIESNLSDKKGIYVYGDAAQEILYVGKGRPIKSRIKSHYNKLLKIGSDSRRDVFFQDNQGTFTVFWLEIEEKEERELVEHLLSFLLNPKYKKWRPI